MKSEVVQLHTNQDIAKNLSTVNSPDLALTILPPDKHLDDKLRSIQEALPDTLVVGATAMQQFHAEGLANNGVLHLMSFEQPNHSVWCEPVTLDDSGQPDLAQALDRMHQNKPDLLITLLDGVHFPVHLLLDQLKTDPMLSDVAIVGGLASKSLDPEHFMDDNGAWVYHNGEILRGSALLIGLNGVDVTTEIIRGWEPASPVFEVTKAEDNLIKEIEGEPAADWYRSFFTVDGQLATLPDAAYGFPLIIDGTDASRKRIYRTMTVFDQPTGCVSFAGDVKTGDRIRLGMGDAGSLVQAAANLKIDNADACLFFSCAAREVVLADQAEEEILALQPLLNGIPFSGFFTFGEIGPSDEGALAYYNQTGVLVLLKENAA